MDPQKTLEHPVSTEKAVRHMEAQNKIVFIVNRKATKTDIKNAIEKLFKVKVIRVRTLIDPKGKKRAYITLSKETPAIDLATKLGIV